jgi:hypothetical protein
MATNLLIAYPDIQYRSTVLAYTADTINGPYYNMHTGPRNYLYIANAAATSATFDFDLGVGITANPNYLILARIDLCSRQIPTTFSVSMQGSTTAGFGSVESQTPVFGTANLVGPSNQDYIYGVSVPYSQAYRYWRIYFNYGATNVTTAFSKLFFGNAFDFGRDPVYPRILKRQTSAAGNRRSGYLYTLTWQGITDATRQTFFTNVYKNKDFAPVFLYTNSYSKILNDAIVVHCWMRDCKVTPLSDGLSDITINFEELV